MLSPALLSTFLLLAAGEDSVSDKIDALGRDVPGLWQLAQSYLEGGQEEPARAVAERILRLDDDHEGAHETLRHHKYDSRWFETYTALSKHMRGEAKKMWEEHGLVRFRDGWAPPDDVPFLRMQWAKDDAGRWRSPKTMARLAQEAEWTEAGWQQQDLVWVHPDHFDRWREGLWKCGDKWLPLEGANEYHSAIGQWWEIPGEKFVAQSTCDRETVGWVIWYADQTYTDLVRLFGLEPEEKPSFVTLNGIPQYNAFAAGDPAQGLQATEASGASSVHYAYFADAWYDTASQPSEFLGRGVCYWDRSDSNLDPYGQHAVRHAAAQSFLEAVDPSWDTVSKVVAGETQGVPLATFWGEKKIPAWLRYGAAAYCERYFRDANVQAGGNPWWARDWAIQNVVSKGGPRPFEEIYEFQLDPNDAESSGALIQEAGLLVSFLLDGDCKPVAKKHAALVKALARTGGDVAKAVEDLQAAIAKNEKALKAYMQG